MNPFDITEPLNLTREDRREWFRYQQANRRALEQYRVMPSACGRVFGWGRTLVELIGPTCKQEKS